MNTAPTSTNSPPQAECNKPSCPLQSTFHTAMVASPSLPIPPPIYNPNEVIIPANNVTGRDNNHGLEGLTVSSDGSTLYALMQSALDQEGGPNNPARL